MLPRSYFALIFGSVLLTACPARAAEPAVPQVVTTIAQAFELWPGLTSNEQAARLEGVVTGTMPTGAFRLHDGHLGIYVTRSAAGQQLRPGDRVRVDGVLRKEGYSPWVTPLQITPLGRGAFPEARPGSYDLLASGAADNQWLQIEGVVRAVEPLPPDFVELDLGMVGGNLRVLVNYDANAPFHTLEDAAVRLRGVAAVNVNKHGHVVDASFRVPSFSEISVLQPGQTDVREQSLVPLNRLMKFSLGAWHRHRVRTSGVVTRRISDRVVFVRDGNVGLKVDLRAPLDVPPGTRIEVAGFPAIVEGMAVLQQATSRVLEPGPPPAALQATFETLLEGTHNSDLVQIRARLLDVSAAGRNVTLVLERGHQLFKALATLPPGGRVALPEKNSVVDVTGICVISELEDIWFYRPRSFLLLVADLADVAVVQAPPWWTPQRLWGALAITGTILLAAAGWVWLLRRQIDRKRAVIEQQTRHAAVLEERSRIARDLHDTLEQGLTGLSLQLKAMETDLAQRPDSLGDRLQIARQMLRQNRALARNAIRELRTEAASARFEGLVEGLARITAEWTHSGALALDLRIRGIERRLPPVVDRNLLGIASEALTNAVKHGRATAIEVEIAFRPQDILVCIRDNGVGFDPTQELAQSSGGFGLLGMRERAREVRGEVVITSQPGGGTQVQVTAPCPVEPAAEGAPERLGPAETFRHRPRIA